MDNMGEKKAPFSAVAVFEQTLEEVKCAICDEYCKYRGICGENQELLDEECDRCPLNRL